MNLIIPILYLLSLPPFLTFFLKYVIIKDLFLSEFWGVSLLLICVSVFNAAMYINVLIQILSAEQHKLDHFIFDTDGFFGV
jgi:NADH:ubiquinone oxidoreductase subunit 2 (subunit N)